MKKMSTGISVFYFFLIIFMIQDASLAQRYWNVAAKFNGTTSSYVQVVPFSGLANLAGSFTVETWFNCEPGGGGTLFGKNGIRLILNTFGDKAIGRLQTNNNSKLYTRNSSAMETNRWYHLACTYDGTQMKFYINGTLDTTMTGANLGPIAGMDTLYIGTSSLNGVLGGYGSFKGMLDDIRIFDRALTQTEIRKNMRNINSGPLNSSSYTFGSGMVMSADFDFTYTGGSGSLYFWDGYNSFTNNNAEAVDLGGYPSVTTVRNTALELSTPGDYVRMSTNADIELTGPMTMEAWIYPTVAPTSTHYIITKKGGWNDPGYGIYYDENSGPKVRFKNNGTGFYSQSNVPLNQWTHIAAVMGQSSAKLYINGKFDSEGGIVFPGANTNHLVVGSIDGGAASESFLGFIDAVKISNYDKSETEIKNGMFEVIDFSNRPAPPNSTVALNFDHFNYSTTGTGTYYYYQNTAKNSAVSYAEDVPVSPVVGNNITGFPEAFYMKSSSLRIPEFNTAGFMKEDSVEVTSTLSISDVKLFIALNHGKLSDLEIRLFSPEGDSVVIWNQNSGLNQNIESIVTVFSDDADSALVDYTYVDFGPKIKPYSTLNAAFGGNNSQGTWRLKIIDYYNGDVGMLYGWGLQFNNITKIEEEFDGNIPENFVLEQNYPNPFNPTTTISLSLPTESNIKLEIFDILGRKVATLINGMRNAGTYNVMWDGNNDFGNLLSSGVYFYRLEATGGSNNFVNLKKMVFLK